jgi:gamma-glutamyltranspeptidase/glutathione hydrolase
MDDFAAEPGKPNAFGLLQSANNAIQAGKRPLSSMTPTLVIEDGRAVISAGASGGPRIITATLQNLLNQILFRMPPKDAVSAPRFHHQWSPNELLLERALHEQIVDDMAKTGHQLRLSGGLAATQATANSPRGLLGGSDPRKYGSPDGH